MGCKQSTIESPSLVLATPPTSPNTPVYVKSSLKKSRINEKGKSEKLSFLKRKEPRLSKSVNFDEDVRVKLRTPTPKQIRYVNTSLPKSRPTQTPDDDDDDGDDQLSSISSQEDIHNEQIRSSTISSNPSLQRNQPNGFWHKNNSVAVRPSTNNIREKNQQQSLVNMNTRPTENPDLLTGKRFRVRRKAPNSPPPQTSNPVDPNQTSAVSSYRPTVQQSPLPVQRSLSNTNAVLIEHRVPHPNDGSSSHPTYYAFSRRSTDKTTSTEK